MKTKTYTVTNIEWDTDGEQIELPITLNVNVPSDMPTDEIDDFISDEISNMTGYCHKGFAATELN